MNKEEFEKAKRFLDSKNIPSSDDILKLFFKDEDNIDLMNKVDLGTIDFMSLGEADDIKTITGTEWVATRLIWETPEGPICTVNLIKKGIVGFNPEKEGQYANKPIFPFGRDTIDIDYEDVVPLSYIQKMNIAVEEEDFEEAAKLRDWDKGLKNLLLKLKPKMLKAIEDDNVEVLDDLLTKIRDYRNTL